MDKQPQQYPYVERPGQAHYSLHQQQQGYQMPEPQYFNPQPSYPQQQFQSQPEYHNQPQIYVHPQRRQSRDENSCLACACLVACCWATFCWPCLCCL